MTMSLSTQRNYVALEAYVMEDIHSLLGTIYPALRTGLSAFVNYFDPKEPAIMSLNSAHITFLKHLKDHEYGDMRTTHLVVPEGLNVPFLDYAKVLENCAAYATEDMPETLNEYATYLSSLISTNTALKESASLTTQYAKMEAQREKLTQDMAVCFKNGDTITHLPLSKCLRRNGDWETLLPIMDKLGNQLNKVDRTLLNAKVKETTELLDLLGKRLAAGELADVHPEVVLHLSEGAYQIGKALEFYSVVHYRVSVLTVAINTNIKPLDAILTQA